MMDLSTALLLAAIVCGVGAALLGQRGRDYLGLGSVATGLMAMLALTILAYVGFAALAGLSQFGLMHLLYLVGVVGIPVLGVTIALVARFLKRGTTGLPVIVALCLAPGALGLYGTHVEPTNLRVDAHRLEIDGIARVVRIAVLSDLQTPNVGEHENNAVAEILAAKPQIVVIPGDLWEMDADQYQLREPELVQLVRRITNEVDIVVMVQGDHDNAAGLARIAEFTGAIFLQDQVVELTVGAQEVLIAGVTAKDSDGVQGLYGHLSQADPGALTVMLSHWPDVAQAFTDTNGTDLVIAGHTHGGQIAIPGFGPIVTLSDVPREVAAGGLHELDGRNIYVSTGVGLERGQAPQVRLGVRPSIGVLDIVPS